MIYQPGKSRLIYMTGVIMTSLPAGGGSANAHMGIFSVDNPSPVAPATPVITQGTYLRCDGTNFYWVDVLQGPTTVSVIQSSWNIDTFDGTGPSGKTLTVNANATKNLLIVIDQEWLGVGRVRCGFIIDGVIYYGHQFLHNGLAIQYTNTPRLNLSYYIATNNFATTMRQMCSTNILEGGYFTTGRLNTAYTNLANFVTLGTVTEYVVLAMRIQSSFPYATFFIKAVNIYFTGGGGKYAQYKIQLFSTNGSIGALTGAAPSFSSLSNSSIEYYVGNGTVAISTPGIIINSGYVDTASSSSISLSEFDSLQTHQLFTKYDTLIISGVYTGGGGAGTMGASVVFVEDN